KGRAAHDERQRRRRMGQDRIRRRRSRGRGRLLARAPEEAAVMSAPTPSFGHGLGAALVLSACGAAVLAAITPWLGPATALRAVIALVSFAYVLYVIGRSGERVGRITTIVCWCLAATVAW